MSDHIPDLTKMISDTPRTDHQNHELLNADSYTSWLEMSGFARQLERELNAANYRIKRLEEALKETVSWIVDLANSGDAGYLDAEIMPEVIQARAALKAKEAKP
jgi:hypothetical protein